MDGPLKELAKLDKLTSAKGKARSIEGSLDLLLSSLQQAKEAVEAGNLSPEQFVALVETVERRKKEVDERQKEIYSSMARFGKALDKRFPTPLPTYTDLFNSDESIAALERTIALHFLRTGQFEIAETFIEESSIVIPLETRSLFEELYRILKALRAQDIGPALAWAKRHRDFLNSRSSPLEFYLHRSQYIKLLLSPHPPNPLLAIEYARTAIQPFFKDHEQEIYRLMASVAFLPLSKLQASPYADLASPKLHFDLEPMFAKEYCANLGMSRQVPLRVVGDIGGGGALARIEKGRKVMREKKSEWNQKDELPFEIPVPPENRYHSIFVCPVSKEQSTDQNPPMMMVCGHVISKDSLQKLSKAGGRVKCPYCPSEAAVSMAMRVHF